MCSLGFSTYKIILSVTKDSFNVSFPIWMPLSYSFCYISLAGALPIMLNKSKRGSPPLSLDLRGNLFSLNIKYSVSCGFSRMPFVRLRRFLSVPALLRAFIVSQC